MLSAELVRYTDTKRSLYLHLNPLVLLCLFMSIVLLVIAAYFLGQKNNNYKYAQQYLGKQIKIIEQQKLMINRAQDEAESSLSLLSEKVGELQSQLIKLNALGQRLTESSGISDLSFEYKLDKQYQPTSGFQSYVSVSDFVSDLEQLANNIETNSEKLYALNSVLRDKSLADNRHPSIMPVKAYVSSWFGWRDDPMKRPGRRSYHEGIDFYADIGTEIKSVAEGIVSWSGPRNNYGNLIEIDHGNGFITRYAHVNDLYAKVGEKVNKGQLIATVGKTGRTTGPHLHFEVEKDGKHTDPKQYITLN